ncbi:MAG TPA: endonuclease III, partial [Candidatus Thermoplasmatota archaeon]|nr:endonuclease III [Candidatus Thermoplasmatota archaeon]
TLPGVGVKTASVVQGYVLGEAEAVAADVHVTRIAYRLGLTSREDPRTASRELGAVFPRADWPDVNFHFIAHGRSTCRARRPACNRCPVADLCPRRGVTEVAGTRVERTA